MLLLFIIILFLVQIKTQVLSPCVPPTPLPPALNHEGHGHATNAPTPMPPCLPITDTTELKIDTTELKTDTTNLKTDTTESKTTITGSKSDTTESKTTISESKIDTTETKMETTGATISSASKYIFNHIYILVLFLL
jgi:hypothetical protein